MTDCPKHLDWGMHFISKSTDDIDSVLKYEMSYLKSQNIFET